jgi:hypothetical protein
LIADGRLRRVTSADQLEIGRRKRAHCEERIRRDPGLLTDLLIGASPDA